MNIMDPPLLPLRNPMEAIKNEHWRETLEILSAHDVVVNSARSVAGQHYARLSEQETMRLMVVMLVQRHQVAMAEAMKQAGESVTLPIVTIPACDDAQVRRG